MLQDDMLYIFINIIYIIYSDLIFIKTIILNLYYSINLGFCYCDLFTYSIQKSHSWEANLFAASQEIPRILGNPNIRYHINKYPPPVPILSQLVPVHIPTSYFLKIHLNIILSSMSGSPQWSLSLRFHHQKSVHNSLPIGATCSTHLIILDFITYKTLLSRTDH